MEKNYVELLIEEARVKAQLENLNKKKKAAEDEDTLLRMLEELRSSRSSIERTDSSNERE